MKLQIVALKHQLVDLKKKGQSSRATGTSSSKDAEHENKIKLEEQVVAQMKLQMGAGAGSASEGKSRGTLSEEKKMDPGKFEDNKGLTLRVWREDAKLIVGVIDKDFKNIPREAKKGVAEVTEHNVKPKHPEFNWELVKELYTYLVEVNTVGEPPSTVKTHGSERESS